MKRQNLLASFEAKWGVWSLSPNNSHIRRWLFTIFLNLNTRRGYDQRPFGEVLKASQWNNVRVDTAGSGLHCPFTWKKYQDFSAEPSLDFMDAHADLEQHCSRVSEHIVLLSYFIYTVCNTLRNKTKAFTYVKTSFLGIIWDLFMLTWRWDRYVQVSIYDRLIDILTT